MSIKNTFGADIANIADDAGLLPLDDLYMALHANDLGAGGREPTSEPIYTDPRDGMYQHQRIIPEGA